MWMNLIDPGTMCFVLRMGTPIGRPYIQTWQIMNSCRF
jgi:hypothetical protein